MKTTCFTSSRARLAVLLLGLLPATGCKQATPDPDNLVSGYVTGQAVDTRGRPLKNASVVIDNTLYYQANLLGNTDENGFYRIKTNEGSWQATAKIKITYHDRLYKLDLEPDNTNAFSGSDGAVRNFRWKLAGQRPDSPGAFYGGEVDIANEPGRGPYDRENIAFTFTPAGPLIDGSSGRTLILQYSSLCSCIPDVPIGRYTISAVYKPTGKRLQIRNRVNGTYTTDGLATVDFYGAEPYWSRTNCLFLEYRDPN